MANKPWFAWEWLYDAVVGELEARLSLNGVVCFTAIVIAVVFAWTFRLLIAGGTQIYIALALVLLALSSSTIHFLARPHVLSWLFTLAWFWILDSSKRDSTAGSKSLWLLPPMMVLWVNIHGGWLVGFVLLGIFLLAALWTRFRTKESSLEDSLQKISATKRARKLAWTALLSAVASFGNPYGWKLHAHVYAYLSNRFLMDHIDEFQSPNFHLVAQKCFPRPRTNHVGRACPARPRAATESRPHCFLRGICRSLRISQHPGFGAPARDDHRPDSFPQKRLPKDSSIACVPWNRNAGPRLADSRHPVRSLHRRQPRPPRLNPG